MSRGYDERDAIKALLESDREALEQLAHALGWKDGGPGWEAVLEEIKRTRAEEND